MTRAAVADAWRDLAEAPVEVVPLSPDTVSPALTLAQDIQHTVYDCAYLAVALALGCPVVTADKRFISIVSAHPYLTGRVLLLNEWH